MSDRITTAHRPNPVTVYDDNGDALSAAVSNARLLSSAATTNATLVSAGRKRVYSIVGHNTDSTPHYLKLYNKATAPTVGTDVPVATFYLPATTTFNFRVDNGLLFPLGLGYALTAAAADNDTTAVAAGDIVCLNIAYA